MLTVVHPMRPSPSLGSFGYIFVLFAMSLPLRGNDAVILLHGLCRSSASMGKMEAALVKAGYHVANVDYPSRTASIEELSDGAIDRALSDPAIRSCARVHFVTHSLGGILVRSYYKRHGPGKLGRVVMLGPPNKGSEVVDTFGSRWLFRKLNGPAGSELGTDVDSTPNRLGPVNFELGVIAGDRSINWINSLLIKGRDDGKVSIDRSKVDGMKDMMVVHATHPFLMRNKGVIDGTLRFLKHGTFEPRHQAPEPTRPGVAPADDTPVGPPGRAARLWRWSPSGFGSCFLRVFASSRESLLNSNCMVQA